MKLNVSRQFVAFLVLGWDLIFGHAHRGPLLGKRTVGVVVPRRPNIVTSPHWKVLYGLNRETPDDYFQIQILAQRLEKMPSEGYPDLPGYIAVEKSPDVWPRGGEYVDSYTDDRNDFPLYDTRMEELAQRNDRRMAERNRKYYPYYK